MEHVFQLPFLCKIKHCKQLSVNKQTKPVGNVWNRVSEWQTNDSRES